MLGAGVWLPELSSRFLLEAGMLEARCFDYVSPSFCLFEISVSALSQRVLQRDERCVQSQPSCFL